MIHKAKDLSREQKVAIETLLRRHGQDDDAISVSVVEPPPLSDRQKHELAEQLRRYFAELDARRQPGSAEEAEEILTAAIRSTRPGYRPHQ